MSFSCFPEVFFIVKDKNPFNYKKISKRKKLEIFIFDFMRLIGIIFYEFPLYHE